VPSPKSQARSSWLRCWAPAPADRSPRFERLYRQDRRGDQADVRSLPRHQPHDAIKPPAMTRRDGVVMESGAPNVWGPPPT